MGFITNAKKNIRQVPSVENISRYDFFHKYVHKGRPVVIKNLMNDWKALDWNSDYFKKNEEGIKIPIKMGDVSEGRKVPMQLSEYIQLLDNYESDLSLGKSPEKPGYLHDVPFFYLYPKYIKDIEPFPLDLFPEWYWPDWHNYIQFFMGATGSLTPLHFDTLCTHNLFFQVVGKKKFILIPHDQKELCYMEGWRWAKFNPDSPDYDQFPLSRNVQISEANIEGGDILFIPSGTLHQVHGLSRSISFNIDWHTPQSARKGVMTLFEGAPKKNIYYNFLCLLGLNFKVPSKYIFKYYKSYLNYVS